MRHKEAEMTRRLGAWDCPYCSTKQILGNVFDCPGFGHPRPRGIQFYQIPDGPFVTYDYECGGYESYTYSCVQTRQEPYSCTKTRDEELYHYENIYDWYYIYDIDKWVTIANYATSGNDHEPYFYSDFELNNPYDEASSPQLGQQRQFQIPGKYSVTFFCKKNTKVGDEGYFTREYSLHEWEMLEYEVDYPIEINAFNGVVTYPNP